MLIRISAAKLLKKNDIRKKKRQKTCVRLRMSKKSSNFVADFKMP